MRKIIANRRRSERADPAPTRWSYRLQRIMLTPAYRLAMRIGVPFTLSAGLVFGYMASPERRDGVLDVVAELRDRFETRPEFMVQLMSVEGASEAVQEDIREVAALSFPVSSFDLELSALRDTLLELPAVADVSLYVRKGNVLQVDVREREPVAIWRNREGLALVDETGVTVGGLARRTERPDLPLIVGDGADQAVPDALAIIRAVGPLAPRLRGLVRMGERRWDVALDRDQRIMLPEVKPVQALERVIALSQMQEMLERDLATVDMRIAARPTIRMNPAAVENWWQIKDIVVETDN